MKKIACTIISIILVVSLCINIIPINNQRVMAADETVLNVMDGNITITDNTYVQKNGSGVITASGTAINNEIILTGSQNSRYNINVLGSNLPTIRFRNVSTNGDIYGTASGKLNVKMEGNCNVQYLFRYDGLPNITHFSVTGVSGNNVTGLNAIQTNNSKNIPRDLFIANINMNINLPANYAFGILNSGNVTIENSNFTGGYTSISPYMTGNDPIFSGVYIKNCNFSEMLINNIGPMILDNVSSLNGFISNYQTSYPNIEQVIKNCDLKLSSIFLGYGIFKIIDSNIEFTSPKVSRPFDLRGGESSSMYIKGSTIITNSSLNYDFTAYSDKGIFIIDSSLNLKAKPKDITQDYTRFCIQLTPYTKFDPLNDSGSRIYLNKLKVPNSIISKVKVSIDNRDTVSLTTDNEGYLYLYLPTGQHTVTATDIYGISYTKAFVGATTNDTDMSDNEAGIMDLINESVTITTPYANANIKYSYDNIKWHDITTDSSCNFTIGLPNNHNRIFIKNISVNELMYADIVDGFVGIFKLVGPIITKQSDSIIKFIKGSQGILFVDAIPLTSNNTLSYQWEKDGTIIEKANRPVLLLSNIAESDAGDYICTVIESDGSKSYSNKISVYVNEAAVEEEILEEIRNLKEQITALQSKLAESNTNNLVLQNTVSELEKQIMDLDSQVLTLQKLIIEIQDEMKKGEDEREDLTEKINNLNSQIDILKNTILIREGELNEAINSIHTLEETVNLLNADIVNMQSKITVLSESIKNSENENSYLSEQITLLENNISSLENNVLDLTNTLTAINEFTLALLDELNNVNNALESMKIDYESEIIRLESLLASAYNTIEELKLQIIDLTNEKNALTNENILLINENNMLKEEIRLLKEQLENSNK
jgi:predicted  nucleic acid-binding Zn-ribbon protein